MASSESEEMLRFQRFHVSIWHGEGGSIALVCDRQHVDDCLGCYSTIRNGWRFRLLAAIHAEMLNDGDSERYGARAPKPKPTLGALGALQAWPLSPGI
jgi:hypothetical protein